MRKFFPISVLLIMLTIVAVLSVQRYRTISGEYGVYSGTIEADESHIGSTIGGRVKQVFVKEGDWLKRGQLLVLFESDELSANLRAASAAEKQAMDHLQDLKAGPRRSEIDQARAASEQSLDQLQKLKRGYRPEEIAMAKAAMEQARQRLSLLEKGPRQEDIDRARADYRAAQANREFADTSLKRSQNLYDQGATSAQALDLAKNAASTAAAQESASKRFLDALVSGNRAQDIQAAREAFNQAHAAFTLQQKGPRREDISSAENAVKQAQANLAGILAGTRPHQIHQAKSSLEQASAIVDQLKARMRERMVLSPKPGQLQVLNVQVGDIVSPSQPVGVVIDPYDLYVRIYIPESNLGGLRVGTRLPVVTDSGLRVVGTVEQIPAKAEFTPRNVQTKEERSLQVFAIKVRLPNNNPALRAGMFVDVRIPK